MIDTATISKTSTNNVEMARQLLASGTKDSAVKTMMFLGKSKEDAENACDEVLGTSDAPDVLPNVPAIFKSFPNWVTYKSSTEKAPLISGTTAKAKSDDPKTWVDYQTLCTNIQKGRGYLNPGFVTNGAQSGNLTAFDIDGGRVSDDSLAQAAWVSKVIDIIFDAIGGLDSTYAEFSPNGGLRIWVRADVSKIGSRKFVMSSEPGYRDKKQQVELFGDGLYFTMTGNKTEWSGDDVAELSQEQLDKILTQLDAMVVERIVKKTKSDAPADPGFKALFDEIGWKPLEDRMGKMSDTRFHGLELEERKLIYCPMPQHQPRSANILYTRIFGLVPGTDGAVVHCFGCGFSGDMVSTVRAFDAGEDGGQMTYGNMYYCARVICTENKLDFYEFFPAQKALTASASATETPASADEGVLKMTPTPVPELVVERMSDVKKKKVLWLWPGRVPKGTITTIAGEPDEGKSLVTLYMAACVTRGIPFYGEVNAPAVGDVLLLCAEDDAATTLAPRLEAAGADLTRVRSVNSVVLMDGAGKTVSERLAQLDEDLHRIEQVLDKYPAIRLIVVDPISSFLGSVSIVKEQEVRRVLGPLVKLCQLRQIAVVLVAHFNKNSETRSALDRVGGAKAIVGLGRAAWTCVREPKPDESNEPNARDGKDATNDSMSLDDPERRMFLKLKGNLTPSSLGGLLYTIKTRRVEVMNDETGKHEMVDTPHIVWLGKTDSTAQDVVIDGRTGRPKTKVQLAAEWLKSYLDEVGGVAWRSDVMRLGNENGHGSKNLQRALGTLRGYRSVPVGQGTSQWLRPGAQKNEALPLMSNMEGMGQMGRRNTVELNAAVVQ